MGSFRNRVLIFAAVFLCLFLHFPSQTEAMSRAKSLKIMAQICKQTENIEVCLQVLLSRPQALFRYDLMAMAENAIQLSRKESNDTVNFFNNLANSKDTNPAFKLVLKNCISNFKEGFMFLNLDGLEGRTATFDMHNAYDKAFACETDLSANKIAIDLVLARIKKWKDVFWLRWQRLEFLKTLSQSLNSNS